MSDVMGFLDANAARGSVRRLKLRRQLLDAQASIAGLLDRLDHGIDPDGDAGAALSQRAVRLAVRDGECAVSGNAVHCIKCQDMREKELLQGADLILQFFNTLGFGLEHGLFSFGDDGNRKRAAGAAESKNGGGK